MRGTPYKSGLKKLSPGIIPAYAGNTPLLVVTPTEPWDHPRVCGEHDRCRRDKCVQRGSSPRMRGTRFGRAGRYARHGIIPAYAGNTQHASPRLTYPGDHPRVCGEHVPLLRLVLLMRGSSTRMRGTPNHSRSGVAQRGIIPAYAGNTLLPQCNPEEIKGSSPRMRGTHLLLVWLSRCPLGSSPRMRGTPHESRKNR